jgi:hypothetical protein
MFIDVKIEHKENDLLQHRWTFSFIERYGLVLTRYEREERATKRHKFQPTKVYDRSSVRSDGSFARNGFTHLMIYENAVPWSDALVTEVRTSFLEKMGQFPIGRWIQDFAEGKR